MRTRTAVVVALALIATTVSAAPAQRLQPLVVDWERYFRVESAAAPRDGRTLVQGTVWNTSMWGAKRVQLLVDALDAGGQVVDQRVIWLGVDLAAGTHAAFEVPMPSAAAYRVSVFAFDSGRGGRWS